MNNIFNNLIDSLSQEFKNFNLDEDIKLSISKLDEYDLQINNLVKYNKSNFFKELQKNTINAINDSNIFINMQTLYLMEHWRVCLVTIRSISSTRCNYFKWRFIF